MPKNDPGPGDPCYDFCYRVLISQQRKPTDGGDPYAGGQGTGEARSKMVALKQCITQCNVEMGNK